MGKFYAMRQGMKDMTVAPYRQSLGTLRRYGTRYPPSSKQHAALQMHNTDFVAQEQRFSVTAR
jgi:hypothetical protein